MSQRRLALLLGMSEKAVSKGLRGLWQRGVPRHVKFAIVCWNVMTAEQRQRVERDLDAIDKADAAEADAPETKKPPGPGSAGA